VDNIKAVKLIALKNVMCAGIDGSGRDVDAQWRLVARWYSKTFSTPLHIVDNLPRLDIIQAFFEERYDSMDDGELHIELQELLKDENELKRSLDKSKADSDVDKLEAEAKEENLRAKVNKSKVVNRPKAVAKDISKEMQAAIKELGAVMGSINDNKGSEGETEGGFSLDFSGLKDI
jgi:hypothetical protein